MKRAVVSSLSKHFVITALNFLMLSSALPLLAKPQATLKTCGAGGTETLAQIRDQNTDLKVAGTCYVNGTIDTGRKSLLFVFHNVNVVNGGALIFQDVNPIDFYAESILVESQGALTAVSSGGAPGYKNRLTIHLWGAPDDDGIECKTDPEPGFGPCGIPSPLWDANPGMAHNLMMQNPPTADHEERAVQLSKGLQPVFAGRRFLLSI